MEIFRTAYVYVRNVYAGQLCETDEGYLFTYDDDYMEKTDAGAVSLTMPLNRKQYTSNIAILKMDYGNPFRYIQSSHHRQMIF